MTNEVGLRFPIEAAARANPAEQRGFSGVCRYLNEFVFRIDRRWQEAELFLRVLHRALDAALLPYHRLTAERIG